MHVIQTHLNFYDWLHFLDNLFFIFGCTGETNYCASMWYGIEELCSDIAIPFYYNFFN